MSDLEDKIREIVWSAKERDVSVNYAIAQIHKAYEEAGYSKDKPGEVYPVSHTADFSHGVLSELMTGQEWYDRWKECLKHKMIPSDSVEAWKLYDAAARRAAGIEEPTQITQTHPCPYHIDDCPKCVAPTPHPNDLPMPGDK